MRRTLACSTYEPAPPRAQDEAWRPSITVSQVLTGIQKLLDEPNEMSPAQADAYMYFTKRKAEYRKRVLDQAKRYMIAD